MKTNVESVSLQAQLEGFLQQAARSPELGAVLSPQNLPQLLQLGFSKMLEAALDKERQWHLQDHPQDRANGYAPPRTLHGGTTPVPLERPRTRQGFYPAVLPKHQRHLPEAYQQLLQNVLLGAKSFAAARRSLQALGLGHSPEQVEGLVEELHQQATTFFRQPLGPDWLCLFADAEVIDLKEEQDQIKSAVHFLAWASVWTAKKTSSRPPPSGVTKCWRLGAKSSSTPKTAVWFAFCSS